MVPPDNPPDTKIDYLGAALLAITFGSFTFVLSDGGSIGWTSPLIIILAIVALIGLIAFLWTERRNPSPLVHFQFFRQRHYVAAVVGMFVTGITLNGMLYFYNIYAQLPGALNFSPSMAGLSLLPLSLSMALLSFLAPRLLSPDRLRFAAMAGMVLMVTGTGVLITTSDATTYEDLWWKLLLVGAGLGLTFSLFPRIGLRALPDSHAGQGSGVINTALYLGTTTGVAAGGLIADHVRRSAVDGVLDTLKTVPTDLTALTNTLATGAPSTVKETLAKLDPADAERIGTVIGAALDNIFSAVCIFMATLAVIGLITTVALLRTDEAPADLNDLEKPS